MTEENRLTYMVDNKYYLKFGIDDILTEKLDVETKSVLDTAIQRLGSYEAHEMAFCKLSDSEEYKRLLKEKQESEKTLRGLRYWIAQFEQYIRERDGDVGEILINTRLGTVSYGEATLKTIYDELVKD